MKDKVCIVTGANSGIGLETARGLASLGATVIMVCRNEAKGLRAQADIASSSGNNDVHLQRVDLASQQAIRSFAAQFIVNYDRLDILVNNAGVFIPKRETTEDGFEATFAINHLAYFLLTHLLLEPLQKTPASRVINVSSDAHRSARIDFNDLQTERGYSGYKAYARSKLANILFTVELARRLPHPAPTVNCLHPGVVATNIANHGPSFFKLFFNAFRPFLLSKKKGAATSIFLATSEKVAGVTGKYFEKCKEQTPAMTATLPDTAHRLYERSAALTGIQAVTDILPS